MTRLTEGQLAGYVGRQGGHTSTSKRKDPSLVQMGLFGETAPPPKRGKPPRTTDNPLEEYEAEQLMQRVIMYEERYPELKDFAHVPNGGKRDYIAGAAMKRQGVRKGYPDYILQYPRQGYHSLIIELKRKQGVPSDVDPTQRERLERLRAEGNRVEVCFGHDQAIAVIEDYLAVSMPLQML